MNTPLPQLKHIKWRIQDEWAEFIARYPWQWFTTLTFVEDIHPESALKSMKFWLSILSRELYGPRWYKKPPHGVYWVVAIEYQKRGVLHLHLLMAGVKNARRLTYMDKWQALGNKNGFARIYPIDSLMAVSKYLSKYVVKDGEIFLSDNLPDATAGLAALWLDSTETESKSARIIPQS